MHEYTNGVSISYVLELHHVQQRKQYAWDLNEKDSL